MSILGPLSDITNVRRTQSNIAAGCQIASPIHSRSSCESTALSPEGVSPMSSVPPRPSTSMSEVSFTASTTLHNSTYRHDPYSWKCLPENDSQAAMLLAHRAHLAMQRSVQRRISMQAAQAAQAAAHAPRHPAPEVEVPFVMPTPQQNSSPMRCLVQFKCHHAEYSSAVSVEKGQYVAVQGDRGMDIGVVIRVNDGDSKTFIERTGPCGSVMRHATQREVDYWASELKQDESTALEFCHRRCVANDLQMEVRHAEYQFDKKKLTFYYDAKNRVDFVTLLKELYREFGCRIWMEKVRAQAE